MSLSFIWIFTSNVICVWVVWIPCWIKSKMKNHRPAIGGWLVEHHHIITSFRMKNLITTKYKFFEDTKYKSDQKNEPIYFQMFLCAFIYVNVYELQKREYYQMGWFSYVLQSHFHIHLQSKQHHSQKKDILVTNMYNNIF